MLAFSIRLKLISSNIMSPAAVHRDDALVAKVRDSTCARVVLKIYCFLVKTLEVGCHDEFSKFPYPMRRDNTDTTFKIATDNLKIPFPHLQCNSTLLRFP